jgi:hypothetical protein
MPLTICVWCKQTVEDSPTCPKCGYTQAQAWGPGVKYDPPKGAPVSAILAIVVFGVLAVMWAFTRHDASYRRRSSDSLARPIHTATPMRADSRPEAITFCEYFVKAKLRNPSTADFPWLDVEVERQADGTYVVSSYVDAKNDFGATIRNNYVCEIRFAGGDDTDPSNWKLVDLRMARE